MPPAPAVGFAGAQRFDIQQGCVIGRGRAGGGMRWGGGQHARGTDGQTDGSHGTLLVATTTACGRRGSSGLIPGGIAIKAVGHRPANTASVEIEPSSPV